jgi:RNA recognition motif-containing protein
MSSTETTTVNNDKLDKTLDEIRSEQRANRPPRTRGGGRRGGGFKPYSNRSARFNGSEGEQQTEGGGDQEESSGDGKKFKVVVTNDKFEKNAGDNTTSRTTSKSTGTRELHTGVKIEISNLASSVEKDDIWNLFKKFGKVRSVELEMDQQGKSLGRAFIKMDHRSDAEAAVKEYDGIKLDDKPMSTRIVGGSTTISEVVRERVDKRTISNSGSSSSNNNSGEQRTGGLAANFMGIKRGGGNRGGSNRGGSNRQQQPRQPREPREPRKQVSQTDLDADLDAYMGGGSDK